MTSKIGNVVAAAMALAVCAPLAHGNTTDNLADLVANNGSLSIGDKTFSGFDYLESGLTGFNPALITVTATQVGNVDYLTWGGNMSVAGIGITDADLLLNYTVTASQGVINEIDQEYTGGVSGGIGMISVAETVDNVNGQQVASSYLTTGDTSTPNDQLGSGQPFINPPEAELHVTKDINLAILQGPSLVTISQVTQSFHQDVPDGGMTLILLGGVFTVITVGRNKVSKLK